MDTFKIYIIKLTKNLSALNIENISILGCILMTTGFRIHPRYFIIHPRYFIL